MRWWHLGSMFVCPLTGVLSRVCWRHIVLYQLRTSGDNAASSVSVPGVGVYWWVGITAAGQSHFTALNYFCWIHWYWGHFWRVCGGIKIDNAAYYTITPAVFRIIEQIYHIILIKIKPYTAHEVWLQVKWLWRCCSLPDRSISHCHWVGC